MKSNEEMVRNIAEEIEQIVRGELYKDTDGSLVDAPEGADEEWFSEMETATLLDYLGDAYDIRYEVTGNRSAPTVTGASFCVALGGPNIWVTESCVRLTWWGDRAEWGLSDRAREEILALADELFNC